MSGLWHYTCQHGHDEIGERGKLLALSELVDPRIADKLPLARLVWMTDLALPIRDVLGLTMNHIGCDRTQYRYRVTDSSDVWPWLYMRRDFPLLWVLGIEDAPGARPAHWYVSTKPVPVELDLVQ